MRNRCLLSIVSAALLFSVMVGCQGETPSLSVAGSSAISEQTILGSWDGTFVINADADLAQYDEMTVTVCKTMRVHIDFLDGQKMNMRATMGFPDKTTETNEITGRWEFVSAAGQAMVIRTTEENGEPKEATFIFNGANEFEMPAPDSINALGKMKFVRAH